MFTSHRARVGGARGPNLLYDWSKTINQINKPLRTIFLNIQLTASNFSQCNYSSINSVSIQQFGRTHGTCLFSSADRIDQSHSFVISDMFNNELLLY